MMELWQRYAVLSLVLGVSYQVELESSLLIFILASLWTLLGGHHTLYLIYHTLPRDLM